MKPTLKLAIVKQVWLPIRLLTKYLYRHARQFTAHCLCTAMIFGSGYVGSKIKSLHTNPQTTHPLTTNCAAKKPKKIAEIVNSTQFSKSHLYFTQRAAQANLCGCAFRRTYTFGLWRYYLKIDTGVE